ncbi:hypothetical protein H7849_18020 [Alloacidobacterium dinghuense]|uniref:Uncharacterized protein n=1 Tax=Alloacidobacterium dinghuense TaxID=2763107 RepID=A0A7G8BEM4_9BACT|nr:hypothetical protein [Alloacidobacterium dinghuense]QNI30994.1 hypothetical protein H7849_18020 [Alloacidobacterium dinghuense]
MPGISEQRLKHLEFVQGVVTRMAGNSMTAKGWSVALTTALIGLATAEHSNPRLVLLALLPPLAFWTIDGYYMFLERCYRDLFDRVKGETDDKWGGFDMAPLTTSRSYFCDGLARPAVWSIHLLIVLLGFSAWWLVTRG